VFQMVVESRDAGTGPSTPYPSRSATPYGLRGKKLEGSKVSISKLVRGPSPLLRVVAHRAARCLSRA
jgi:hypothetical protein